MIRIAMELAKELAKQSYCDKKHVGCVITHGSKIIGKGYNKIISHENMCCLRRDCKSGEKLEQCNAIHAEQMAMTNKDITNCTVYVTHFPCAICTKMLVEAKIKKLYYIYDYPGMEINRKVLKDNGVFIVKVES